MENKIKEVFDILKDKVKSKFVVMKIMEYANFDKVEFKGYTMIGDKKIKHQIVTKRNRRQLKFNELIGDKYNTFKIRRENNIRRYSLSKYLIRR